MLIHTDGWEKNMLTFKPIEGSDVWETKVQLEGGQVVYFEAKSKYGTLYFGQGSDDRIGWGWQETGGGGAITIPFTKDPGEDTPINSIWVGLLPETRVNMGSKCQLCAIGGFKHPQEQAEAAHRREFASETGEKEVMKNDYGLMGLPINSNRLYFIADPFQGEGVHAFGVEVPWEDLQMALDCSMVHRSWQLKGRKVTFFPWQIAVQQTADALAGHAIARLLAMQLQ